MKLQPYVEKLNSSKKYQDFKKKYPDAFLVAGFFVIDLEMKQNIHQIDFYLPKEKKFAAFTLDQQVTFQLLDTISDKTPEKLDIETNTDLDELKGIVQDGMKNRNMTEEIKKIIAVLQNIDGKKIWNLNCVLSGMEILKSHVEDESKTILKMEKISIMDLMKKVPVPSGNSLQMMNPSKAKPEQIKEEIKKLDDLEKEIQKEKEELLKAGGEKEVPKEKVTK